MPRRWPPFQFHARVQTEYFDLGSQLGIAVYLANGRRVALRHYHNDSPALLAARLRMLAEFIDEHAPLDPRAPWW